MSKTLQEMTEQELFAAWHIDPRALARWEGKHFSLIPGKNPPPIDAEKPEYISTRVPGLKFDAASGRWVADA